MPRSPKPLPAAAQPRPHAHHAARRAPVKDARYPDALLPMSRYHPFVTNSTLPTAEADITHRRHAIIETTFADLIDEPLAHVPSTSSPPTAPRWPARRSPTTCCAPPEPSPAVITPWPAAPPCAATWSASRPASQHQPANPRCTYPSTGPAKAIGKSCATTSSATQPRNPAPPEPTDPRCPPRHPGPNRRTPKEKVRTASAGEAEVLSDEQLPARRQPAASHRSAGSNTTIAASRGAYWASAG